MREVTKRFLAVVLPCVTAAAFLGCDDAGETPVTTDPSDQTVVEGQTATFSVTATGSGTLTYQWQKDGVNVTGGSGGTSSSYTTPATVLGDSGAQYTCVVSNAAGRATSAAATLTVNVDDSSGVFETVSLFVSGGTLPGSTETATAVRALAVNDNRVVAVEADLDTGGTALLLVEDGADGAAPTVVVIIKTGDALPNSAGTFDHVVPEAPGEYMNENVYVDSSNRVVFMANDSTSSVLGIFRAGMNGGVKKMVAVGDAVASDTIATIQDHLAASPAGLVAFIADLSTGDTGVFYRNDTGTLYAVAVEGDPLPGAPASFFGAAFAHVFVNDSGHVGFKANSIIWNFAWVWRAGGSAICLAWPNDLPMPGLPASTVSLPTIEGVLDDGRVVVSSLSNAPLAICMHRYSNPGTADVVVVPGTSAPSGDRYSGLVGGDLRAVASGWVSCQAAEVSSGGTVLFRQLSGTAVEVARHGAAVPGGGATITNTPRHRLGASGRIVYYANTSTVPMLCRMDAAGQSAVVANQGQLVPGSATDTITAIDRDHFFVNGTGGIVYTVTTSAGTSAVLTGE